MSSYSTNPIIVTAAVANWAAMALPNNLALDARSIFWENPTAIGDVARIKNADGTVLWEAICEASTGTAGNSQIRYFQPRELLLTKNQGWYTSNLTSGTLFIDFVYA